VERQEARRLLVRRALFLLAGGLLFQVIWPADILHYYGVYLPLAVPFLFAAARWLWVSAIGLMVIYVPMMAWLGYWRDWKLPELDYVGFWTATGFVRNLLFNGFHPVVPWLAFLLLGLWLGRRELTDPGTRQRILKVSAAVAVASEAASLLLVEVMAAPAFGLGTEVPRFFFSREAMPPAPLYMAQAGATAVFVIAACVAIAEKRRDAPWLTRLAHSGQLALSIYVAHVVIGLGVLDDLGLLGQMSMETALVAALLWCVASIAGSHLWRRRVKRGPLEWLMRTVTRSACPHWSPSGKPWTPGNRRSPACGASPETTASPRASTTKWKPSTGKPTASKTSITTDSE